MNKALEEKLLQHSKELIYRDCRSLLEIYNSGDEGVILMSAPYSSLVLHESTSFIRNNFNVSHIEINKNQSSINLSKVRNKIHMFDNKFKKRFLSLTDIDDVQNDFFLKNVRWWAKIWIKKFNLHDNLGIYFNKEGHIVGNTHYIAYIYESDNWNDIKKEVYKYGIDLGEITFNIMNFLNRDIANSLMNRSTEPLGWQYKDYNTNNAKSFPEGGDKYLELFFLHFISIINFVLFELPKVIKDNDELLMRIRYIVCHYTHMSIEKLMNQYKEGALELEVSYLKDENADDVMIDSSFRGSMAHYSFINDGEIEINEECYNQECRFFGLVESKFGMNFHLYHSKLIDKLKSQSDTLLNYITIDLSNKKCWNDE